MEPIRLLDQLEEQFPAAGVFIAFKEKPAKAGFVDYGGMVRLWGLSSLQAMGMAQALQKSLAQMTQLDHATFGGPEDLPPDDETAA